MDGEQTVKIAVVGAGNGGCFTALHYGWYTRDTSGVEIELIHNPDIPAEAVGQATILDAPALLYGAMGLNWHNNNVYATPKFGVEYEGWGKVNERVYNPFPLNKVGMHFCPKLMQDYILTSSLFKIKEDDVGDIKNVDADYIFDCRGKPEDNSNYEDLVNPINAVILAKPNWDVLGYPWTKAVATPDGWTFIIPTHPSSPSHDYCVGYLYNNSITSTEDAERNCLNLFDVEVKKHLQFNNYVAKNPIIDDRIFLNGNRLFFLEPLEASAVQTHLEWARFALDVIFLKTSSPKNASKLIRRYIEKVQNFILWHYKFGSKYDTPFWNYASRLKLKDPLFNEYLKFSKKHNWNDLLPKEYGGHGVREESYAFLSPLQFKGWYDGMTIG